MAMYRLGIQQLQQQQQQQQQRINYVTVLLSVLTSLYIIMFKMRFLYLLILTVKQYNIRGVTIVSRKFEFTDHQL